MIRGIFRWLLTLLFLGVLAVIALIGTRFMQFVNLEIDFAEPKVVVIPMGTPMNRMAKEIFSKYLPGESWQWILLSKIKRVERKVKAGEYQLSEVMTPSEILEKLVRGDVRFQEVRIPEGATFSDIRNFLEKNPLLNNDSEKLSEADLAKFLGEPSGRLEGRLYPDTYRILRGTNVTEVMKKAYDEMQTLLLQAWQTRKSDNPLKKQDEALVLASIVEKETGKMDDIPLVASVFINRLRVRMPLQSDPTVIYGLGDKFRGNLTRKHLRTPTAYNTYTISRLPPTPIASISKASLLAVLNPPDTNYYYFVARGDGSSQFSRTLSEHNRAVNKYQRRH